MSLELKVPYMILKLGDCSFFRSICGQPKWYYSVFRIVLHSKNIRSVFQMNLVLWSDNK